MTLICRQILLNVSDLKETFTFYVEKLGFELIEEHPKMFAFRAGDVRFSVFGGGKKLVCFGKSPRIDGGSCVRQRT